MTMRPTLAPRATLLGDAMPLGRATPQPNASTPTHTFTSTDSRKTVMSSYPSTSASIRSPGRALARSLAAALVIAIAACSRGDANTIPNATRAVPVEVAPVTEESLTPPVSGSGTLAGKDELSLAFTIGGVVARVLVDEGSVVRQGQLLAELVPVEIGAQVATAVQARDKADRDLARVRALHADSIATTEQLQDATTALAIAQQNVVRAQFNQEHAVVRAPMGGVVLRRLVEPSQVVSPGTPVLQLRASGRGVVLRVALPDRDAVRVRVGDEATVAFDALPGERFSAHVSQVAALAGGSTGTIDVELTLERRAESLASGLIGRADIRVRSEGRVATVPLEAIVEANGDSASVFVVADGATTATRRAIRLGQVVRDRAAVLDGLRPGELVVVRGAAYLDEGTTLAVHRDSSRAQEDR